MEPVRLIAQGCVFGVPRSAYAVFASSVKLVIWLWLLVALDCIWFVLIGNRGTCPVPASFTPQARAGVPSVPCAHEYPPYPSLPLRTAPPSLFCALQYSPSNLAFPYVQYRTGLDLVNGNLRDNVRAGIVEPGLSKVKCLKFATEAAITILRIDESIKIAVCVYKPIFPFLLLAALAVCILCYQVAACVVARLSFSASAPVLDFCILCVVCLFRLEHCRSLQPRPFSSASHMCAFLSAPALAVFTSSLCAFFVSMRIAARVAHCSKVLPQHPFETRSTWLELERSGRLILCSFPHDHSNCLPPLFSHSTAGATQGGPSRVREGDAVWPARRLLRPRYCPHFRTVPKNLNNL